MTTVKEKKAACGFTVLPENRCCLTCAHRVVCDRCKKHGFALIHNYHKTVCNDWKGGR